MSARLSFVRKKFDLRPVRISIIRIPGRPRIYQNTLTTTLLTLQHHITVPPLRKHRLISQRLLLCRRGEALSIRPSREWNRVDERSAAVMGSCVVGVEWEGEESVLLLGDEDRVDGAHELGEGVACCFGGAGGCPEGVDVEGAGCGV